MGLQKSQTLVSDFYYAIKVSGLPRKLSGKESTCNARNSGTVRPWVRKIPRRRKWKPSPVFLPGESHGQRSLAGYSSWGPKRWT